MFCGILPWTWFSSSLIEAAGSLIAGGNLIKKVLFPAEVLPIVSVLANMVHFFLGPADPGRVPDLLPAHCPTARTCCGFRSSSLVQLVFTLGAGADPVGADGALPRHPRHPRRTC